MSAFEHLKTKYLNRNFRNLGYNEMLEIRTGLQGISSSELTTVQDHREYIAILKAFREQVALNDTLNGEKYSETLTSLLSVGADGVYSNDLRFMYELIQNVDDCNYGDMSNCKLSIRFDTQLGRIILEYNEIGFLPEHVFAITGIAEASKNISPEKVEIGEKGIGFKSVFGIADKVLIQSGRFSFYLLKDNFTIPIEAYDDFSEVSGTRLTLFVGTSSPVTEDDISVSKDRGKICSEIYRKISDTYCNEGALFNQNPILFLNKLTSLKFYIDEFRSMEFSVDRNSGLVDTKRLLQIEREVVLSVRMSNHVDCMDTSVIKSISCTRYTMPIVYDRSMCVSRYGEKTAFNEKQLQLQVIVPNPEDAKKVGRGSMYSFLPTRVGVNFPISCHIPFKLDSSREHIDNQNNNAWFKHSIVEFSKMMEQVYLDLAVSVKQQILYYLPHEQEYFFSIDSANDKLNCLRTPLLRGSKFLDLPLFYTQENQLRRNREIFCFSAKENIDDPEIMSLLIDYGKELFIPPEDYTKGISAFGIKIEGDVHFRLLKKALCDQSILRDALNELDKNDSVYFELAERLGALSIPFVNLPEISRHKACIESLNKLNTGKIKSKLQIDISVTNAPNVNDVRHIISPDEPLEMSYMDNVCALYFTNRKYGYVCAPLAEGQLYFVFSNLIVFSETSPLEGLARFCSDTGKNNYFSANMTMRSASLKLNQVDDSLSKVEYLILLRDVRHSIKSAFGKTHYESYIKVIRELNSNPHYFIRELLQNADDCDYPDGETPSFSLEINGNTLKTQYNERGFSKANVRAITAIGESTKKQLQSGSFEIGEKGIGFKTVFSMANRVDIHSGGFDFSLSASTPTIPDLIDPLSEPGNGTVMLFSLSKKISTDFLSPVKILMLCLCLRKLRHARINNIAVTIEDVGNKRIIEINGESYIFHAYRESFTIEDPQALSERRSNVKSVSKSQEIVFYIPQSKTGGLTYHLYSGLPTAVEIGVPFSIDAPFELTASRDHVLQNAWNKAVCRHMYIAYSNMLVALSRQIRIKVMRYVRFLSMQFGTQIKFELFKSADDDWLNSFNAELALKSCRFIPTCDEQYFTTPNDVVLRRYPAPVLRILESSSASVNKRAIIDDPAGDFESVLKNLGCRDVDLGTVASIIRDYARESISDEKTRKDLYKYLADTPSLKNYASILCNAAIIPVKPRNASEGVQYIAWNGNSIFIDNTASLSSADYQILDTGLLSKSTIESVLCVDVPIMDASYKKVLYEEKIEKLLTSSLSDENKFLRLTYELNSNPVQMKNAIGVLLRYKDEIPLHVLTGEYKRGNIFLKATPKSIYLGQIMREHIVSDHAAKLAALIGCRSISLVSYDELGINRDLTSDDVEDLIDPEIKYGYNILEQCMFDGLISDELIAEYELFGIVKPDYSSKFDKSDFPNEPVRNIRNLREQIISQRSKAYRIVKVDAIRSVSKVEYPNGKQQLLNSDELRRNTMRRYHPLSNTDVCFCQMCLSVKSNNYIEVNNLQSEPQFYWPQMRIALCLECSKQFEQIRANELIMDEFYDHIISAPTDTSEPVAIPIGSCELLFTQTHLAEIQEILRTEKK